ncbi:alpha-2-macroglobulin [Zavarzinia sp. CC-PAN008]|uniref:alpha-2-macroglobulin n=1 Tax=Zavarzinia sp. CC-PAN008 TaxID=3243332 RepID=UPI003F749688
MNRAVRVPLHGLLLVLGLLFMAWSAQAAVLDGLKQEAANYVRELADRKLPNDPEKAQAANTAGRLHVDSQEWYNAAQAFEKVIAFGGSDHVDWMNLANSWLRQGWYSRAAASAWVAWEKAGTDKDRAEALVVAATALIANSDRPAAVEVLKAATTLKADDEDLKTQLAELQDQLRFRVVQSEVETTGDAPRICVQFQGELPRGRGVVWSDYVTFEPPFQAAFTVRNDRLCIDGPAFGTSYAVTVAKGLPAAAGEALAEAENFTVDVGDRDASLGFRESTYVLPRVGSVGLPLVSVNVSKARLNLYRVPDRNLIRFIENGTFLNSLDTYSESEIENTLGEKVWTGEVDIESEENQRVITALPVDDMRKTNQPGVYVLTAAKMTGDDEYWAQHATQWLVVTDVGLTTFAGSDGMTVAARSLETGHPVSGVTLRLYARNNEELASASTDENGIARFDPGLMRGTQGRAVQALMAFAANNDFTFLNLDKAPFDLSDRGVGGRLAPGPIDAYVYTDRGVYRPGETAHIVALLRNPSGVAVEGVPLTAKVFRPDGVEASRELLESKGAGGFELTVPVSATARTGRWTASFFTDPEAEPVGTVRYLVEDVVPARIETTAKTEAQSLVPGDVARLEVEAKYLFGAPAAGLRTGAELVVAPTTDPFPAFPGYSFGLVDQTIDPVRRTFDDTITDPQGKAVFDVSLGEVPDTPNPLAGTLRVEVFEMGGRPVVRTLTLPVRTTDLSIGIKPVGDGAVAENTRAGFDVIALDRAGAPRLAQGLHWTLLQEEWSYQWFYRDGAWDYELTVRDQPVTSGTIDVAADKPARIDAPVTYGRFRLEVADGAGRSASSVRFTAGWYVAPGIGDTPDQLTVTTDKPVYQAGETAKVFLQAPFPAEALVTIATDRVRESRTVTVPAEGVTVEIPVAEDWGGGAYVLANAFRPGEKSAERGPGRAIGTAWLAVDPAPRTLGIALDLPAEVEPRQSVEVPVTVTGQAAGKPTFITVAAVDEGVLQLTDFESPKPVDWFFGKRSLGVQIRDAYGALIDGRAGKPGVLRQGGDGDESGRRGAPPPTIEIVALFSGVVNLDSEGKATIRLALPDYNGRLRLMAVAWNDRQVGAQDGALVVRDPVVVLTSLPRFLATGDVSELSLSLNNVRGGEGRYDVKLAAEGAVALAANPADLGADMKVGGNAFLKVPVTAVGAGLGVIHITIEGPQGYKLVREARIGVRAPQLPQTDRVSQRLEPGKSYSAGPDLVRTYVPGTASLALSVSAVPNLDLPGVLRSLQRYPYGCLEQTTSVAMPLIYYGELAKAIGADADQGLSERLQRSIARILEMQNIDGSFSLWSSGNDAEPWLTAYAMDFLTRARGRDLRVPDLGYRQGLKWLKEHALNRLDDGPDALASRAYANYVLAAAGVGELGAARYMFDTRRDSLPTPLAAAQLGAAFQLQGDTARASAAFDLAMGQTDKREATRDYGTRLRDLAAIVSLMAEVDAPNRDYVGLTQRLSELQSGETWLSTQELGWLMMAGRALSSIDTPMTLSLKGVDQAPRTERLVLTPGLDDLEGGYAVGNKGELPVWLVASAEGVPAKPLPALSSGFTIERRYFTAEGEVANLDAVPQGAVLVAVVVGKRTEKDGLLHQNLVVDLLPAGFEVENPRLVGTRMVEDMAWLPDLSPTLYTEALDDRFVAQIDLQPEDDGFAAAYLVRAVTPGTYAVPPAEVEDMYKPRFRARTAPTTLKVLPIE